MKICVECRATVMIDVKVTARQIRQLEAGEIKLTDVVDESLAYEALRTDGVFEFEDWDPIPTKRRKP